MTELKFTAKQFINLMSFITGGISQMEEIKKAVFLETTGVDRRIKDEKELLKAIQDQLED